MPFNQAFTLPASLTLTQTKDGVRMLVNPVKELEILRKPGAVEIKGKELTADAPSVTSNVKSDLVDVVLSVKKGTASKVTLQVGRFKMTYDFASQKLDNRAAPMKDGVATIRIVVDRPIHEIIGGNGASYLTGNGGSAGKPIGEVKVTAEGGTATIESLGIYEMKSIWKK